MQRTSTNDRRAILGLALILVLAVSGTARAASTLAPAPGPGAAVEVPAFFPYPFDLGDPTKNGSGTCAEHCPELAGLGEDCSGAPIRIASLLDDGFGGQANNYFTEKECRDDMANRLHNACRDQNCCEVVPENIDCFQTTVTPNGTAGIGISGTPGGVGITGQGGIEISVTFPGNWLGRASVPTRQLNPCNPSAPGFLDRAEQCCADTCPVNPQNGCFESMQACNQTCKNDFECGTCEEESPGCFVCVVLPVEACPENPPTKPKPPKPEPGSVPRPPKPNTGPDLVGFHCFWDFSWIIDVAPPGPRGTWIPVSPGTPGSVPGILGTSWIIINDSVGSIAGYWQATAVSCQASGGGGGGNSAGGGISCQLEGVPIPCGLLF